jgi:hypothetical protein
MPLADLTESERSVVYRCLHATLVGPFFGDAEFHTLIGLTRSEFKAVLQQWPQLDDSRSAAHLAINNSFANLLGYPHAGAAAFGNLIGESFEEVERIFAKWAGNANETAH